MRRCFLPVVCFGLLLTGSARSQDLPTTHDHGITITPDDLGAAIQESQDFWGPVRKHLLSDECTVGDVEQRKQAVAFLKDIHDGLHHRLFEQSEAEAMDLIRFLGHRLRMFEVYRRLRTAVADDLVLLGSIEHWEQALRDIHALPLAEQQAKIAALVESMGEEMRRRGLTEDRIAAAAPLWKLQAGVVQTMAETGAGRMMIDFEVKGRQLDEQVGSLLLRISTAADWVLIVRDEQQPIGRLDFIKSFAVLDELRSKQTAGLAPHSLR